MKVRELMEILSKANPEANVEIDTYEGTVEDIDPSTIYVEEWYVMIQI
jgi:chitodextrinase